jgi:Immunoglobulin-like domain of bacterial spore germination
VSNPVTVQGTANVFEANVNWQLLDGQGHLVKAGHATAGFMQWKPFTVHLGTLKPGTYTIRAYEASARNGNPTHVDKATFTVR